MSASTISAVLTLAHACCNVSEIAEFLSLEPYDVRRILRRARVW